MDEKIHQEAREIIQSIKGLENVSVEELYDLFLSVVLCKE